MVTKACPACGLHATWHSSQCSLPAAAALSLPRPAVTQHQQNIGVLLTLSGLKARHKKDAVQG